MDDLIKILDQEIIPIIHDGKPVLTFRQIDLLHKRPEGTARKRFADNRKYFVDGEDYYILQKTEIVKLSEKRTDINSEAPKLALVTETGYLSLVKSFNDDLAWRVQKILVKNYFRNRNNDPSQMTKLEWIEVARQQEIEKIALIESNKSLENKIQEDKPLVEFASQIQESNDAISIGEFAKILNKNGYKTGQNRLFANLRELKLVFIRDRKNVPYQTAIEAGWLKYDEFNKKVTLIATKEVVDKLCTRITITGKGQVYVEKKLRKLLVSNTQK